MGKRIMAIHFTSYLNPNQNEGINETTSISSGINKTTVAIRSRVNIIK